MFQFHIDELRDLLKGKYTLLQCPECEKGTEYWDEDGNLISQREYNLLIEKGLSCDSGDCPECDGLGKIIKFDEE